MPKEFTEKILNRIKQEHITPRPRWHFLAKDGALWAAGALAIAIGSVAVSVVIFVLANHDWAIGRILHDSVWGDVFSAIPLAWLGAFVLFVVAAHYNACSTKRGYRFHTFILIMAMALPIVFGYGLYRAGASHVTEELLDSYFPGYQTMLERRDALWMHPEQGILGGRIVSVEGGGRFILQDRTGDEWEVYSHIKDEDLQEYADSGAIIGVTGERQPDGSLVAESVRLLKVRGGNSHFLERHDRLFILPPHGGVHGMNHNDDMEEEDFREQEPMWGEMRGLHGGSES